MILYYISEYSDENEARNALLEFRFPDAESGIINN